MKKAIIFITALFSVQLIFAAKFTSAFASTIGNKSTNIEIELDDESNVAHFKISGPSSSYIAFGFGGSVMENTYTFVCNTTTDVVVEYKLGDHNRGSVLTNTLENVTSTTTNGIITIEFDRALTGSTSDYYTFLASEHSEDIIYAMGSSKNYQNHGSGNRGSVNISYIETPLTNLASSLQVETTSVSFYPNPSSDYLNLNFSGSLDHTTVVIMSPKGERIQRLNFDHTSEIKIDIQDLVNGIYMIGIENEVHRAFYSFVKN